MKKRAVFMVCALLILAPLLAFGETNQPAKPKETDKCPVCGMFVSKYPDWIAQVVFKDGSSAFLDGPKDMFTYYLNVKKYSPSRGESDMVSMYVTEYYSLKVIDARKAFYVAGSDVYGPMGKELIPFGVRTDAEEFLRDHGGRNILTFDQVTADVLRSLQ